MAMSRKILKMSNVRKTINYLKKNGIRHACYAVRERIEEERKDTYTYTEPQPAELLRQRKETEEYPYLFSIVVPAYHTKEEFLREMIESVRRQSYQKWELILADASQEDQVGRIVKEITQKTGDIRIKYRKLNENKGISGNTNAGIALAAGDYIALLDHDDVLAPDALYYMAMVLQQAKEKGISPYLIYTDEDKLENSTGLYNSQHQKENFNMDLILSNNYICHFMAVEAGLMKQLLLRKAYDGAQDYDLVLRVVAEGLKEGHPAALENRVLHVPRILYHWRCHAGSTAENTASKAYAYEAGKAALEDFCQHQGWRVRVCHSLHLGFYQIAYEPDMFSVRADVGIVGGRILDRQGRICAGAYDQDGKCLYEGLPGHYSGGSTHRAVLKQDCPVVDIRCMQVRPALREIYEEITGLPYQERELKIRENGKSCVTAIADVRALSCDEAGYRKLSRELCRAVREKGYRIVWNPEITMKWGKQE